MLEIYWSCLIGGMLFAITTVIFGDVLGDAFDGALEMLSVDGADFLQPIVIVGGITVFGGTGILLEEYTGLTNSLIIGLSIMMAVLLSSFVYFLYVKPMKNSENSTGYSVNDLIGKIGEVIVPIPSKGYGEVLIRVGAGNTNQIAASINDEELSAGIRVIVAEVRDDTVYVFRYED